MIKDKISDFLFAEVKSETRFNRTPVGLQTKKSKTLSRLSVTHGVRPEKPSSFTYNVPIAVIIYFLSKNHRCKEYIPRPTGNPKIMDGSFCECED